MTELKLLALDTQDLEVLSTHVQDAVLRVGDMGLSGSDNRFALLINRFAWEVGASRGKAQRRRAALRFEHVTGVRSSGFDTKAKDGVLDLLSVEFVQEEAPGGVVSLAFAGGGTVFLDVECLEVRLSDMGAAWATKAIPSHKD